MAFRLQAILDPRILEVLLSRKMILLAAVLFTASPCGYCSSVTSAEAVQWREDLHFFSEQAPQVHKNLYHAITR